MFGLVWFISFHGLLFPSYSVSPVCLFDFGIVIFLVIAIDPRVGYVIFRLHIGQFCRFWLFYDPQLPFPFPFLLHGSHWANSEMVYQCASLVILTFTILARIIGPVTYSSIIRSDKKCRASEKHVATIGLPWEWAKPSALRALLSSSLPHSQSILHFFVFFFCLYFPCSHSRSPPSKVWVTPSFWGRILQVFHSLYLHIGVAYTHWCHKVHLVFYVPQKLVRFLVGFLQFSSRVPEFSNCWVNIAFWVS